MLPRLSLAVMALTLTLLPIAFGLSCSARDDAGGGGDEANSVVWDDTYPEPYDDANLGPYDETNLEAYKEVTVGDILTSPEDYAGQRVLVSGRSHGLAKIAIAVDYYWTDWGIGDGSHIIEVYLVSDACLFWDRQPDYEENEEIQLPGVVTVGLLGSGRFPSAFLLVSVKNVDIETHRLSLDVQPGSLVGKLIGGKGEIVCVDREEGTCIIQTAEGVRLDCRLVELPPEYQAVGLHVRFAGIGVVAGESPTDGIPIRLYYLEDLEAVGWGFQSREQPC